MRAYKSLLIAAALATTAFAGPYDAWAKYRNVKVSTLDTLLGGAGVMTANTNYALLVRLSNASQATGSNVLSEAGTGGASLRFTNAAGDTALKYEIDTWTATSAAIWVKVPVVKGNDSTIIRMYWGNNAAVSESSGPAVFDTANGYRSVWHMGNAGGLNPRPNATAFSTFTARPRSYSSSPYLPAVATGAIGTADTLGGGPGGIDPAAENLTNYFFIDSANATGNDTTAFMFPNGLFTVSYWVTTRAFGTNNRHFNMQASALGLANPAGAIQTIPSSTAGNLYFRWSGSPAGTNTYNTVPTAATWPTGPVAGRTIQSGGGLILDTATALAPRGGWQHVVGIVKRTVISVDSTRDSLIKIIDGQTILETFGAGGATLRPLPEVRRPYVMLGRTFESGTDGGHNGKLDEVTFMNRAVTRDWARLTFMTQRPDQNVVTLGATVTPGAPGQPTAVTGVAANGAVVLSWTAPTVGGANGAAASYTVASTPAGGSCTSFTTSCLVTGLTNGTGYTFAVTASNASGSGTASAASSSVTPVTTGPAAPGTLTTSISDGAVSVGWATVAAATGGYKVFSNPGNFNCTQSSVATSCNITGLTNGTAYTFRVLGSNGTVYGATGTTGSATPATVPGAPTNANATVSNVGVVSLTWTAPVNNGGAAVTGYTVTVGGGPGTCPVTGAATTSTCTGLTFGIPYTFDVRAVNSVGPSATFIQTQATPVGRPATPVITSPIVTSGTGATVSWAAVDARGSAITAYTVFRSGQTAAFCTSTGLTCTATIAASGSYTFRMVAANAIGVSDTSAGVSATVTGLAGAVAKGLFGFAGENTFRVSSMIVPELEKVTIRVTDVKGHLMWNRSMYPARDGVNSISWNKEQGFNASAGVYMVHAEVTALGGVVHSLTRKSTLLKP